MDSGSEKANVEEVDLPHMAVVFEPSKVNYARSGGRPRKWRSDAERMRRGGLGGVQAPGAKVAAKLGLEKTVYPSSIEL